jgi:hypothetical protein
MKPDWCAYCGESAAGGETVDLPSRRWISLCPRHTRQNLDRYHGGYGAFIAVVDKMPDSFWSLKDAGYSETDASRPGER